MKNKPNLELAHQAAESIEDVTAAIMKAAVKLANGLEVKKPDPNITLIRASALRAKLVHALELTITLEALLKK